MKYVCLAAAACFASSVSGQTSTSIEITRSGPDASLAQQGIVVFTHLDFDGTTPAPTGTITITDGTDSCIATLPETFCLYQPQTAGTKTLTADYSGDANFDPSTSPGITHEVAPAALPERVSVPDGFGLFAPLVEEANMASSAASVSADGRFVAFQSDADNLVPADFNSATDVFVQDRLTGSVVRISTDFFGGDGFGPSRNPQITADGRRVVFESDAPNLVGGDSNAATDIFVHDRLSSNTQRISVNSDGAEGNFSSVRPSISEPFGQFIAFDSAADNLVDGDTNFASDVFVRDRFNQTTERVSVDSAGMESDDFSGFASISADGQSVLFESNATNLVGTADTNGVTDVFVHDRDPDTTERVSISTTGAEGNAFSSAGSTRANLSDDGQLAVFETQADNLSPGDDMAGQRDILLRDRNADTTTRITLGPGDVEANGFSENASISANGGFVAFRSLADNLVADDTNSRGDIFVHDLVTGENEIASLDSGGRQGDEDSTLPTLSADGQFVAFETDAANLINNDNNMATDVFARDRNAETTLRASEAVAGTQSNENARDVSVSANGRFVAFNSDASNLVPGDNNAAEDIFVLDRDTGEVERVSVNDAGEEGDFNSFQPSISDDGRFVTFFSDATNLVDGDTGFRDVFVHGRDSGTTERVSVDSAENQADGDSFQPTISSDGSVVAFGSNATNLVVGDNDNNGQPDIFVRDLETGDTERVSVDSTGTEANGFNNNASISDDGRFVAFESTATNLVATDSNGANDIFVHDRNTGETKRVSISSDGDEGTGGNQGANRPSISGDGRFVAFEAEFTNLVPNDTNNTDDVFVHDRDTGNTERVSVDDAGDEVDGFSINPSISANGRFVAFTSGDSDLDPDVASNGFVLDIFVHDRETGNVRLVSADRNRDPTDANSFNAAISGDGLFVAFGSLATNLVPGDSNQRRDVYLNSDVVLSDGFEGL